MKNELESIAHIVQNILSEDTYARNNDTYLYLQVCKRINPIIINLPFVQVLQNVHEYGLPPFESVRRSRQKEQEKHPELRACKKVEEMREDLEEEYREFARSGK